MRRIRVPPKRPGSVLVTTTRAWRIACVCACSAQTDHKNQNALSGDDSRLSFWAHSTTESCQLVSLKWKRTISRIPSCWQALGYRGWTSAAWLRAELGRFTILAAEMFVGHVNKTMVACGLCATSEKGSTADISRQNGSQDRDPSRVWSDSRVTAGTRVSAPKAKCCSGWNTVYSLSRIDSIIQFCFTRGQNHKNKQAWV